MAPGGAAALDELIFEHYLSGLHDTGWHGDPRVVRFGFAVATVLRTGFWTLFWLRQALERSRASTLEQSSRQLVDEYVQKRAESFRLLFTLAEESRQLLSVVPELIA